MVYLLFMGRHCSIVSVVVLAVAVSSGTAMGNDDAPRTQLSVGTDLSPWFLNGYSAMVFVEPASLPAWRFGAELWSMQLPNFAIEMVKENREQGFSHDIRFAGVLYADRTLGETAWHAGALVNVMLARISRNGTHGDVTIGELLGRVGYRFLPMGPRGIFLDPWFGLGPQMAFGDLPELDGRQYKLFPLQPIATVHAGYRI